MNRLTRYDICLDVDMPVALNNGVTVGTAICTLAEYEDTGLTPNGVKELKAKEDGIVRCKDCAAYTSTGPGTGVCPALGGVAENDGCTMGDPRLSAIARAELSRAGADGRIVLLDEYPAKKRYEAAEYLSDWLKEATFEDASVGVYAINSDTADVISGVISALNNGLQAAKEK